MKRYLVTIDVNKTDIKKVLVGLKKNKNVKVDSVLKLINTIIIEADDKTVAQIKKSVNGIQSIENEGEVRIQE